MTKEIEALKLRLSRPMNAKERSFVKKELEERELALESKKPTGQTERSPAMSRDRKDNVKTQKPKPKKK